MKRQTLLAIALAFLSAEVSAQGTGDLTPGPVPGTVGFSQLELIDNSRDIGSAPARPITVSIWYPAVASSGSKMRLETYVELHRSADSLGVLPFLGWVTRSATDTSRVAAILSSDVTGRLEARPAEGRYPLILYAASFRAPAYENFALFEYLAGFGFVVAAIPSVGHDVTGMSMDSAGVRAQTADFELAYQRVRELPYVDAARTGTMGFSLGAVPAVTLALDNQGIRATVSIDGAFNYTYALLGRPVDTMASLRAAYLQLTQRPIRSMPMDNSFFERNTTGDAYHLQWRGLDHYDFGSLTALLRAARPKDYRPRSAQSDPTGVNATSAEDRMRIHKELIQTIHLFFDAHINDSSDSRQALEARFVEPDWATLFSVQDRQ